MLRTLTLDGYRSFPHYEVENLTAVNLFVGRNNSGKTSLLEAIQFFASKGSVSALLRSPKSRGEANPIFNGYLPSGSWATNVTHLFHGREIRPDSEPRIRVTGGSNDPTVSVTLRPLTPEEINGTPSLFEDHDEEDLPLALEISGSYLSPNPVIAVSRNGSVLSRGRLGAEAPKILNDPIPTRFLAPDSLSATAMHGLWDGALIEGREAAILDAVRIVAPELESLSFLTSERPTPSKKSTTSNAIGILARLRDRKLPVPFGSLGDGPRRVLALSLSLIAAADGILLADEIDTGMHWRVMHDLWQHLIETSRRHSVQIFATTHGLDSLRGIASLFRESPDLASAVSVYKLDRRLKRAVRFDADNVDAGLAMNIELR